MSATPAKVASDLDKYFAKEERRIRAELDDFLRIPSVSARSEHNADTARCAEWLATQIRNGNYPTGTISLKAYTVADLPADPADGLMVFCTDDVGGAVPVFSFGGQWLRVTDRAVAS